MTTTEQRTPSTDPTEPGDAMPDTGASFDRPGTVNMPVPRTEDDGFEPTIVRGRE
ncbi:hypothetical protein [Amycolatopsis anabasis]|uniref:hypothetical protein n=1 Tax=Amycolatopsis anabasis TaxID=1840409 RepID=UPI00131BF8AD|nr:hypothetical protein [Amycolatopsis anabasis]